MEMFDKIKHDIEQDYYREIIQTMDSVLSRGICGIFIISIFMKQKTALQTVRVTNRLMLSI